MSRRKGHSVLGGICGLFFGLFVGLDLVLFGVVPFNSAVPFILVVLGLVGGVVWGRWAPIGAGRARAGAPAVPAAAAAPSSAPEPSEPDQPADAVGPAAEAEAADIPPG